MEELNSLPPSRPVSGLIESLIILKPSYSNRQSIFFLITTHNARRRKYVLPNFPQNLYDYTHTYIKDMCDEII